MHLFIKKCFRQNTIYGGILFTNRFISNAEIATALRPFYFVVHPDLFGRFPQQRSTNEESLKHLSAHLEAIQHQRTLYSSPRELKFYVRDSSFENRDKFKLVKIYLERGTFDLKLIIKKILETCNLSTEYVDKIKTNNSSRTKNNNENTGGGQNNGSVNNDEFYGTPFNDEYEMYHMRVEKAKQAKTLKSWLVGNLSMAYERSTALETLKEDVEKLQKSLSHRLKLKDLQYDCGWNIEHYRGCLKSFERLVNMHEQDMKPLEDRILVFAPISGVSLEGHIMLFTGDVQHNWLDFIKNISKQDEYLKRIPAYELALSQVMRHIQISRRKFMPKAQVVNYAAQLRKVTTSMLDYLTYNSSYPKSWPDSLSNFEIVIESGAVKNLWNDIISHSEAGPLMVSPTGQFIAPSTCPGSILVDFLTTHLSEATEKAVEYKKNKYIERELHERCHKELLLNALTKDDSIDPNKMIQCLERLLNVGIKMNDVTLNITHYYSVLSDGTVCIPWDWSLE